MSAHILILPGDGIGPEVMVVAVKFLDHLIQGGLDLTYEQDDVGGAAFDHYGHPIPESVLSKAKASDAILFGAVGSPKHDKNPYDLRPEAAILTLRRELDLFANLRPAKISPALLGLSSLKAEVAELLDVMIVRETTAGVYFGEPRGIFTLPDGKREGVNTHRYHEDQITRITQVAIDVARARGKDIYSVEKANVMEAGKLWREVVTDILSHHPDIKLSHMYADNAAMQLVRNPAQFDVLLTDNLFGDILSDLAAQLTGSLGLLPSATLGAVNENGRRFALYEPIHGSAPDIAGQDLANPIAMILSMAMMFHYSLNRPDIAKSLENAVAGALDSGARTKDIAGQGDFITCSQMGERIFKYFK